MATAAVGFRPHTGWSAAVVLSGSPASPRLVDRRRVELTESRDHDSVFVFHAAAQGDPRAAAARVRAATEEAEARAIRALAQLKADVAAAGHQLVAGGLIVGALRTLPPLADLLRSHALIHSAEGELYRQVLATAGDAQGLALQLLPARELEERAAQTLGLRPALLARQLAELGKTLGPPWGKDQKDAALAAWLALAGSR
ncbi:MAG TPA: hypothetical protein VK454_02305 [Myxococcaceae bacterium]|nr:hypothetical protein [Myxococcaceae bacterium]